MKQENKNYIIKIVLQFVGILALSLLIWFLGPVISVADYAPLENIIVRIVFIFLIVILWIILLILKNRKEQKAAEELMEGVSESSVEDDSEEMIGDEVGVLGKDFSAAMELLKFSSGGKSTDKLLYQLPWYMIIGPPGSGKTTALVNSGLDFPLADKLGDKGIKGVGGTRNCDWWFTEDAILIDTAGRYTTQDSHELVDKGGWLGFLDLLKKHRPRRPINGAIVAMSFSDLLLHTQEELKLHAKAIRERILELDEKLGVEIPVYVMFTKCDLVAGFLEFFDDLDEEGRLQVWGHTFNIELKRNNALASFQTQYKALIQRLDDRVIKIMQNERDLQKRSLIFGFSRQMEELEIPLVSFLDDVFSVNRYQKPSLLRGIYFTSGTQEGSPIDRVLGDLATSFDLDRQSTPLFSGQGKSFFITRLLTDVIFNEAELVGVDPKRERQRRLLRMGIYGFSGLALLSMSAFWFLSYSKNNKALAEQHEYIASYESQPEHLRWQLDFKQLDVRMNSLEAASNDVFTENDSWLMKFGLYQGKKLALPAKQGYERFLENYFLPAIRYRFEERLQDAVSDSDELLYELLKVYLMLDNSGKRDVELMKAWVGVDWELEFAKEPETLANLKRHLEHLLVVNPEPITLNTGLISSVRRVLTRVPISQQIYSRIKSETVDNSYDVTAKLAMGRFGKRVFVNVDGGLEQLNIPGLYTSQGYRNLFQKHSLRIIKEAIEQDWVLNRTQAGAASAREVRTIQMEIQQLYIKDYIAYWDGFLNKIKIRDTINVEDTTELIGYLSGKDSPLKNLLLVVEKNTAPAEAGKLALGAAGEIAERTSRVRVGAKTSEALLLLKDKAGDKYDVSIEEVDEHFEKINQFIHQEKGQASELDSFLSRFSRVYSSLIELQNKNIFAGNGALGKSDGKLANELQLIKYESTKLDNTTKEWMNTIASKASGEVANNLQKELNQEWKNEVYTQCKNTVEGRYPLNKGSRREVNLADFTQFFTKQGVIDGFFTQYLKGNVDTAQGKWKLITSGSEGLSISSRSVRNFQYAASIRDKYFKYNGNLPSVKFSLKPLTKTEDIAKVVLEIDGQKMEFDDSPIRAIGFNWPGGNVSFVRVSFEYKDGSTKEIYQSDGSWALFRFIDISASSKIRNSTERVTLNVTAGASGAKFELYTGGGMNPFSVGDMRYFRCPKQL